MTTDKQIAANRRNSQSSTGPKTDEGKQKSSQNAISHGLLAKAVIVHGEKRSAFESFRQSLFLDLQPEGAMEQLLVEKIANYAWRLRRAVQAEAAMMDHGLTKAYDAKTLDYFFVGSNGRTMNNLSRYESMLAKHFYRAMSELRLLQRERQAQAESIAWNGLGIGFVS